MTSAVRVRGLSKTYGRLHAVQDLDLDVGYGEIFAILGPNGAGKSTTIEILEGHRKRDAGQVRVLGEDPGQRGGDWRARIGIVLQEASDFGMLTVLETVQMFAKCYGDGSRPRGAARTRRARLESPVRGSGRCPAGNDAGSTSRSASSASPSCCSWTNRPPASIPKRDGNSGISSGCWPADGTTIVLTTHYLEEAAALADRVAVIAGGRVVAVDSPARLTAHVESAATVRWMEGDEVHVEETDHPTELIRQRSTRGAELAQLTVTRPTLEDAYLHLIGLA